MKSLLHVLFIAFTLFSCSKSPVEKTNQPPGVFQATVSNVTINTAQLNWTPSVDPENSQVTYTITLGNDTVSKNQSGTQIAFSNLQLKTFYTGNIIAYDANGNNTKVSFSFTTGDHPTPSDFTITQTNLGITYGTISWTASTLPDNASVTYDVYLNNTLVAGNITTTSYRFEPLLEKNYIQCKGHCKKVHKAKALRKHLVLLQRRTQHQLYQA